MSHPKNPGRYPMLVKTYELDYAQRVTPAVLYRSLQEAAEYNAVDLGFDSETLLKRNLTWMLVKMHLFVERYPVGRREITVVTWPSGMQSRFAFRQFEVLESGSGPPIARASSVWMLFDVQRGRPVLVSTVLSGLHVVEPRTATENPFGKFSFEGTEVFARPFPVRLADIDINGHVSNRHYVEWLTEGVPEAVWQSSVPVELQLEFKRGARYGDTVLLTTLQTSPDTYVHRLASEGTGDELVVARSVWRRRD